MTRDKASTAALGAAAAAVTFSMSVPVAQAAMPRKRQRGVPR
ncbi:hypothetical protein [Streptosporangium sp. NPDC000396]